MKYLFLFVLCLLALSGFAASTSFESFDSNVFTRVGYRLYLNTNAISAIGGGVSSGTFGTTNGASTNVGGFLKALTSTQYWSFNGVGLTNLSIPLASVTNAGTAGYSNAGAFVLSKDGSATNLTIRSNVVIRISSLESNSIIGPTGVGITYLFRNGLVRQTNSVTLDWIDYNDGLKIGSQSSANSATISLDALTGLPKFTGLTVSRATVTGSDGYLASSATTGTQVGYLSDVTGLIQAQIDGKTTSSDTAFGPSWNGVTAVAPSKNAVYDWAHTFDTDDNGKVNVLDVGAGVVETDVNGVASVTIPTGSGVAVKATSPTLVTPILGVAAATTINKVTLTAPATGSTLTLADGKTATISKTMTFTSAGDSGVLTLPNATATIPATSDKLSVFAATTSAELSLVLSDESGNAGVFPRFNLTSVTSGDYIKWDGSTWVNAAFPNSSPGGSTTQVQFNDAGSLAGDAGMTYNKTTDTLSVGALTGIGGSGSDLVLNAGGQMRLHGTSLNTDILDPNGNLTFESTSTGVVFLKAGNQTVISANSSLLFMDTVPVQGGASTWTTLGASGQITGAGASNYLSGQLRVDGAMEATNSLIVGTNGGIHLTNVFQVATPLNRKALEATTDDKVFVNAPMTFTVAETNTTRTANTLDIRDAKNKGISLANGGANTFLQGTTPPTYTTVANAALANSTITFTDGAGIGGSGSPTSLGGTYTVSSTTATPQFAGLNIQQAGVATTAIVVTNPVAANQGTAALYATGTNGLLYLGTNASPIANGFINGTNIIQADVPGMNGAFILRSNSAAIFRGGITILGSGASGGTNGIRLIGNSGQVSSIDTNGNLSFQGSLEVLNGYCKVSGSQGVQFSGKGGITASSDGTYLWGANSAGTAVSLQLGSDQASPALAQLIAGSGSGTDKAGGQLTIGSGKPTGAGTINRVLVAIATNTTTGSTAQNYAATSAALGGDLKTDLTTTGNVGGSEDTLISYTVKGGVLGVNGTYLEFDCWGYFTNNANAKDLSIYFGATKIFDSTALVLNGIAWRGHGKVVRRTATTQEATCEFTIGGTLLGAVTTTTTTQSAPAETLASDVVFKVTGTDSGITPADNSIVQTAQVLRWQPGQ